MTRPEQISLAGTVVRPLSEMEIQQRLYGNPMGGPKAPQRPASSPWTGSEILTAELTRLRSELISLRQEKEKLAVKLERAVRQVPPAARSVPKQGSGRLKGFFLFLFLLGGICYWVGGAAPQASPSAGDSTPYTVQVAVYNGRTMAGQAQGLLKELGYDAFLVSSPRLNGGERYRVYVGSFVTKEEAARESRRLAADSRFRTFKDAFVRVR